MNPYLLGALADMRGDDWRTRAACRGAHDLFDPLVGDRTLKDEQERIALATWICRNTCTVRNECLEDALEHKDYGVRGGLLLENGTIREVPKHHRSWNATRDRERGKNGAA